MTELLNVKWGGANGGEDLSLVADGRVVSFIDRVMYRRDHDSNYRAGYNNGEYIHNLLLDTLEASGATTILKKLKLPHSFACPHKLYALMCRMPDSAQDAPPHPPTTRRISSVGDLSVFDDLLLLLPLMIQVEQWYASAYEWIIIHMTKTATPQFALFEVITTKPDGTNSEDEDWGPS